MSSVRDSYRSRDYHKGTGSRVFLTENPGCYTASLWSEHLGCEVSLAFPSSDQRTQVQQGYQPQHVARGLPTRVSRGGGGGATDDLFIIKNLPLYLGDSARTWLKHLPRDKINGWTDLR
jgi:hypothetical protein